MDSLFSFFDVKKSFMAQSNVVDNSNSENDDNPFTNDNEKGAICPLCMQKALYFYCRNCLRNGSFTHSQDKKLERFAEKKLKIYEVNGKKVKLLKQFEEAMASKIKLENMKSEIKSCWQMNEHLKGCIQCVRKEIRKTESKIRYLQEKNQFMNKRMPKLIEKIFTMQKDVNSSKTKAGEENQKVVECHSKMKEVRQTRIDELMQFIFPITKTTVDKKDAKYYDLDCHMQVFDVTGQWELAGESNDSNYQYNIVESYIPANGNYSAYIDWTTRNTEEMGTLESDDYLKNTASGIITSLSFVSHLVSVLGFYLDAYMPKRLTHSEFMGNDLARDLFLHKVAKLNANVIHLCLSQNVDPSCIRPHHTLNNLTSLLLVRDLGRSGPLDISQRLPSDVEEHLAMDLMLISDEDNDNGNSDALSADWVEVDDFADDSVTVCEFGTMVDQPFSHRPSLTGEIMSSVSSLWRAATWQK